jgi:tRNA (uracil-5-)-methyltransferase
VPFTLAGELVSVHVHRHEPDYYMSHGDLLAILEPSAQRKLAEGEVARDAGAVISPELAATKAKFGERVQCKYFG